MRITAFLKNGADIKIAELQIKTALQDIQSVAVIPGQTLFTIDYPDHISFDVITKLLNSCDSIFKDKYLRDAKVERTDVEIHFLN